MFAGVTVWSCGLVAGKQKQIALKKKIGAFPVFKEWPYLSRFIFMDDIIIKNFAFVFGRGKAAGGSVAVIIVGEMDEK